MRSQQSNIRSNRICGSFFLFRGALSAVLSCFAFRAGDWWLAALLLFAAGILWEQAFGGRCKPLPRVWSLSNNVVNLGASIRGDARIGWYGQNI